MDNVWLHVKGEIWDLISQRLQEQKYWRKVIKRTEKPLITELATLKRENPLPLEAWRQSEEFYNKLLGKRFLLLDMLFRKTDWKTDRYSNASFHELTYRIRIYFEYYVHILLKEDINLVVFWDSPHMGWDYILYEVARSFGITTLILEQSRMPDRFFHFFEFYDYGKFTTSKVIGHLGTYPIERYERKKWFYMKKNRGQETQITLAKLLNPKKYISRLRLIIKLTIERNDYLRLIRELIDKNRRPQSFFRFYTERFYKKALKENVTEDYSYDKKYVYFPLHYQPEKVTTAWAGIYLDQVLAIDRLSKLIPKDWFIYVKENPWQKGAYRNVLFFERLKLIPNAKLLSPQTDTYELTKNSQFVATITGTAGYEAVTNGKNVLLFGWGAWYQNLPGIYRYREGMDVLKLVTERIDHQQLEKKMADLHNICGTGIIREAWIPFVQDYTTEKNTINVTESLKKILYSTQSSDSPKNDQGY